MSDLSSIVINVNDIMKEVEKELKQKAQEKSTTKRRKRHINICDICDNKVCERISSLGNKYPTVYNALPDDCPLKGEKDKRLAQDLLSINYRIIRKRELLDKINEKKKLIERDKLTLEITRKRMIKEYLELKKKKISLRKKGRRMSDEEIAKFIPKLITN